MPSVPPPAPPASSHHPLPNSLAAVGLLIGVGGLAAAVLSQEPAKALPVAGIGAAVAILSMLFVSPGWRAVTGVTLAVATVAASVALWVISPAGGDDRAGPDDPTSPPIEVTAGPSPGSVQIVEPAPGQAVPPCSRIDVRVAGAEQGETGYMLAQRETNDSRYYYEPLRPVGNVGATAITVHARPFRLWVLALDSTLLDYLSTVTDEEDATYWSSPDWPPGAVVLYDQPVPLQGQPPDVCPGEV